MSKYIPPHLRRQKEEEERNKIIVPISEEAKVAPPPSKWNFRAALLKNNKEFEKPKKLEKASWDYMCVQCNKLVKRDGLNNNGTKYCWECHSKIIFGNSQTGLENYDYDYEDDNMMVSISHYQKMKLRYQNYLEDLNNADY